MKSYVQKTSSNPRTSLVALAAVLVLAAAALPRAAAVTSCKMEDEWLDKGVCRKCLSRLSPFSTTRGGYRTFQCYRPTTLSAKSTRCTDYVLPSFIRSESMPSKTVKCLNPTASRITIGLPTMSSKMGVKNLIPNAYIKASFRLSNTLMPRTTGMDKNGQPLVISLIRGQGGNQRLFVQFDKVSGELKSKKGMTVKFTGVLRRPGMLLDACFVSYLKVCK